MIKVGVIGGAGYTAGELLRILVNHPEVEITFASSNSQKGKAVSEVHTDLFFLKDLNFVEEPHTDVDVLFLCMGHGKSKEFLEQYAVPENVAIIDLSADYRLDASFVYGLPEVNKATYGNRIANPGCFATAIQLGLLPLAKNQLLKGEVHINAMTGSTGAGQGLSATTHFSWRQNNVSAYKVFEHQHLDEINMTLEKVQGSAAQLNFVPMRGSFTRGIFATMYCDTELGQEELFQLYQDFYAGAEFVHCTTESIDLKQVVNSNYGLISVQVINGKAFISSGIDNLLKGASGQAVQNMNIVFGLNERFGLKLKPSFF